MAKSLSLVVCFFISQLLFAQSTTVSGVIREKKSGENIPYVTVVDSASQKVIAISNLYGFYSYVNQTEGISTIIFRHLEYGNFSLRVKPTSDTTINIVLDPLILQLNEIIVEDGISGFKSLNSTLIPTTLIKQAPALLGEKDVLKTIQLQPGVQRGIEGSTNFYVRGGGADQNLIIADDATIYNANHLFGFVSVFNSDAIKNVNFYKGSFPARYGGRVASVTDIQVRDGNKNESRVEGGIGLLSGRLTLEGPIQKNKSSYLISARRSFIDLLTRPFMSTNNKTGYSLFDVNAKLNFILNNQNRILFTVYTGGDNLITKETSSRDQSTVRANTNFGWINKNASLQWNHLFTDKLFSNVSLIFSHYNFYLEDTYQRTGTNANYTYSNFSSGINDYSIKQDLDYYLSNSHTLKTGFTLTVHQLQPRIFYSYDQALSQENSVKQNFRLNDYSFYFEDTWQISKNLASNAGVRLSHVNSKDNSYTRVEPRVHLTYSFNKMLKINAGYTRSNQFLHLLSNTGVGLPTDLWVPVTTNAPPQQGDLISAGIERSFQKYRVSIETYRRFMKNIITYRQDAEFLDPNELSKEIRWEDNIATGRGEAYGTEFLLEKQNGNFTGSLAYTLSWVVNQFDDINNGKIFFPRYDSRHNVVLFCSYKISEKVNLSASWFYSTGNALSVPQAYYYGNFANGTDTRISLSGDGVTFPLNKEEIVAVPYLGSRNSYRGDAYHRLDISIQLHKKKKNYERYWEFGLFNAYNRKNPFYYYLEASNDFANGGQKYDLKKKSLFPILPSVTYNFKF